MNRLDKLLGFVMAAGMLAAFALPANAGGSHTSGGGHTSGGNKTISLSVTPSPAPLSSETTKVYAKIKNTGNSNANSFEIDWKTSPYFIVTSASAQGSTGSCSTPGLRGSGYSRCIFTKQLPTKTEVTITLNVQVTNQCASLSIDWYAYAWTGAPGPVSQSFTLESGSQNISSLPASCTIEFVTQPTDAFIGSIITGVPFNSGVDDPVSVKLLRNGAAATDTEVSLSAYPASCATGAASATTDSSGVVEVAFTGAASGSCVLKASAPGYGFAHSNSFQVVTPNGELGCDVDNNTFGTTGAGDLVLNGRRLGNVDDPADDAVGGSEAPDCEVVPYVVSTTCPIGVTGTCTNLLYDPLDQGTHMAFYFEWEWPLEAIPDGGLDAIPKTLQLFINGNPVPVELDLCPGTIAVYVDDEFVELKADPDYAGPLPPFPRDQDFDAPGTQAGCDVGVSTLQDGRFLKRFEKAWVQGDYTATRR